MKSWLNEYDLHQGVEEEDEADDVEWKEEEEGVVVSNKWKK